MTVTDNAVARRDATTAIAIRAGQDMFDDRQVAALAVLGVKDATKADLAVYFHVCRQTGLDPFLKQIYLIARQEKVRDQWVTKQTIQVGIDGFRVIRDRAAKRDGVEVEYSRTIWYDHDGGEHKIWLRPDPPAGCEMTVYKNGRPYPAVLTYAEYVQTKNGAPTGQWRTAPAHQLEKCCEAFGLRRAFPHDLAGIRLEDEMPAAEQAPAQAVAQRVTAADITTQRPRRQAASPAPEVHDAEIVIEPAPAAAAEPAETGPGPGRPGSSPNARPTSAALAKLGKALTKVRLGTPEDLAVFLAWAAGRSEATRLEALTHGETEEITKYLDKALKAADDDGDLASSRIWTAYRDAYPAPEPDDSQEAADE